MLLFSSSLTPLTAQQVILLDPTGNLPIGLTSRYWIDGNRFDFVTFTEAGDLHLGIALTTTNTLLKAEPTRRSAAVTTAETGQLVEITVLDGRWVNITFDDYSGWVIAADLINVDAAVVNDPLHHRHLVTRVWYPSIKAPDAPLAPYMPDFVGPAAEQVIPLWGFDTSDRNDRQFVAMTSHARLDVPVSAQLERYPVILLMTPFPPETLTMLTEELTSHGYIVVGIHNTYPIVYEDGTLWGGEFRVWRGTEETIINYLAQDIRFVLDQLEHENAADGLLEERLDLEHVGIIGGYFDVPGVLLAATADARIDAVIGIGTYAIPVPQIEQAYLEFHWPQGAELPLGPYHSVYPTSDDLTFFDFPTWNFPGWLSGTDDGGSSQSLMLMASVRPRDIEIVRTYARVFFDTYLRDEPLGLLGEASLDYPELNIICYTPN